MTSSRAGIALLLFGVALALTSLAYASPPDPTWVGGFWDDGDFDDVVIAIASATAVPAPSVVARPPIQTAYGLLLDVRPRADAVDVSLPHAPRSPPTPPIDVSASVESRVPGMGGLSAMDKTTERLLRGLQESPTDLAKLVERVAQRPGRVVAIPASAIARWRKDDPDAWQRVRAWLTGRGSQVVVLE